MRLSLRSNESFEAKARLIHPAPTPAICFRPPLYLTPPYLWTCLLFRELAMLPLPSTRLLTLQKWVHSS